MTAETELHAAIDGAITTGDVQVLSNLIMQHPELPHVRLPDASGGFRSPLHAVASWPGYYPNARAIVNLLLDAGADPNSRYEGWHEETPVHMASSMDDVEVLEALLDGGGDVAARGGTIAGGTPLDNAIGFGAWLAAQLLAHRGAPVTKLWHAAALGLEGIMMDLLSNGPTQQDVSEALWHSCRAGQRRAVSRLLLEGADPTWTPPYHHADCISVAAANGTQREEVMKMVAAEVLARRSRAYGHSP